MRCCKDDREVLMFIGRDAELQFLNRCFVKDGSRIVVVYGERGVGKTTLVKKFTSDKKSLFYAARACHEREQRFQWGKELQNAGALLPEYPEYEEIFRAALPDTLEKQVLVLDEFQHLIKSDSNFFRELIAFLENRRMSRPVMVVLISSAAGWVENSLVGRLGGTAVYLGGFLKVKKFAFSRMLEMFPGYCIRDAICHYAVLGGVPGLWNNFSQELTVRENIVRNILRKESRLYGEMSAYLTEELREPAVYNTILAAIAGGTCKLNDIYRHTGFPRAKISVYLKNLMELDLVEKVYAGVYRITNAYIRFYFRFLFPNRSLLEELEPEEFYSRKVEPDLPFFVEEGYRNICLQMFAEELPPGFEVNEWTGRDYHIDIAGVDGESRRIVASCVYSRGMTEKDYKTLLAYARKARIKADRVILYSEKGFDEALLLAESQGKIELRRIAGAD